MQLNPKIPSGEMKRCTGATDALPDWPQVLASATVMSVVLGDDAAKQGPFKNLPMSSPSLS